MCVLSMEQSASYAAMKDALTKPYEMEYAEGMGRITILMKNLLHLIYHIDQHMMKLLQLFPIMIFILPRLLSTKIEVRDPPSVIVCQVIDYVEV